MTDSAHPIAAEDILSFWFSAEAKARWFKSDDAFDALLRDRFGAHVLAAKRGAFDGWSATPEGALALVILLDQIPRNIHRGTPEAFSRDAQALAIAEAAIVKGFDQIIPSEQRNFFYLPFMHSERLADQDRGMQLFAANDIADGLNYMRLHRDIIAQFGRFPHRNAILGRQSTPEELEFLRQPGSSF